MKKKKAVIVFSLIVLFVCGTVLAKSVFVNVRTAKLRSGTSALDKDVEKLELGDELKVKETSGRWIKVKTEKGTEGWIYERQVSDKKPKDMDSLAKKPGDKKFSGGSGYDASAAARGVSSATYAKNHKYDIKAVEEMEKSKVADDTLDKFFKDGKLAEYGEVRNEK